MLKKFLTTIYLLALSSTPTHAYPVWATAIARSECEYLALGFSGKVAFRQALRDNRHWFSEMLDQTAIIARILQATTHEMCPDLVKRTAEKWHNETPANPPQPFYFNGFKL